MPPPCPADVQTHVEASGSGEIRQRFSEDGTPGRADGGTAERRGGRRDAGADAGTPGRRGGGAERAREAPQATATTSTSHSKRADSVSGTLYLPYAVESSTL